MSVITLLTDFGNKDEYVGTVKGVILSINPYVTIVDITHFIDPYNLTQTAYIITSFYKYFPKGTVHTVVVDPGVGTKRAIIAIETDNYVFLAPDNGILTLIAQKEKINSIIRIENDDFFLKPVSQTFHGRDIFAPVAAHISKGTAIDRFGSVIEKKEIKCLSINKPCVSADNQISGQIVSIDQFGNLVTNIDKFFFERFNKKKENHYCEIQISGKKYTNICICKNYKSAKPQTPIAIFGSRGYLEISLNRGSAKQYFMTEKGDDIIITISK